MAIAPWGSMKQYPEAGLILDVMYLMKLNCRTAGTYRFPGAALYAVGAAVLFLASTAYAQSVSHRHSLGLGAYAGFGDFGERSDTDIYFLPLSYRYDSDRWSYQVMVPHLAVRGSGNVLVNLGGLNRAFAATQRIDSHGLGDIVGSLYYHLALPPDSAWLVDFRADVKFPTADEFKSLGTGEYDYSGQVDLTRYVGRNAVFVTAGYSFRGQSDVFAGLEDSAFAQLGFAAPVNNRFGTGIFYDYRERASLFSVESHEILPYINYRFSDNWSASALVSFGMTEASADRAIQLQLQYGW